MKVRELVAKLMEMDPDAEVIVYSRLDEGADWAHDIEMRDRGVMGERPYVKGDWPDRGMELTGAKSLQFQYVGRKVVIIK